MPLEYRRITDGNQSDVGQGMEREWVNGLKQANLYASEPPPGTGESHWGRMNNFGRVEGSKVLGNTA